MGTITAVTNTTAEQPFFFAGERHRLFGVVHRPDSQTPSRAVVLCHPFAEEKLWAHRVFVSFARTLAASGFLCLRFDMAGNGDSDGDFSETSFDSHLADIGAAVTVARAEAGLTEVTLVGLRLGATAAAAFAARHDDVSRLVLWNPVVDGSRYMLELLRINLSTQMTVFGSVRVDREGLIGEMRQGQTVNIDGYEMALPLFEQVSATDLRRMPPFARPCLLVHMDRNPAATPPRELAAFAGILPQSEVVVVQEEPFWKEIPRFYDRAERLSSATLAWMERT